MQYTVQTFLKIRNDPSQISPNDRAEKPTTLTSAYLTINNRYLIFKSIKQRIKSFNKFTMKFRAIGKKTVNNFMGLLFFLPQTVIRRVLCDYHDYCIYLAFVFNSRCFWKSLQVMPGRVPQKSSKEVSLGMFVAKFVHT